MSPTEPSAAEPSDVSVQAGKIELASPFPAPPALAPAFYASSTGGWRDYWTLLHPPYTIWHLSYVLLGAALAPSPDPRTVAGALVAFGLAVGVGSHAFDELHDRPLRTRIPSFVLVALAVSSLAVAAGMGLVAATFVGPAFLVYVALGAALVVLYGLEVPLVHSDLGFAIGWGAFPVAATACAVGAHPLPAALAALAAAVLSLAQRRLSTRARTIRRRAEFVAGEVRYSDGRREILDARALIGASEAALSLLWLGLPLASLAMLLTRWL